MISATSARGPFRKGVVSVVISGQPGDDAKPYQERDVRRAIEGTP
jgi:hypothetical protein